MGTGKTMKILAPVKKEIVSPEVFIKLSNTSNNIERSRFIAPKIGGKGFGKFEVTYRYAELRHG